MDHSAGVGRTLEGWLNYTHHSLPEALHIAGCILVAFLSLAYVMCIFPQRLSDMQIRGTREGDRQRESDNKHGRLTKTTLFLACQQQQLREMSRLGKTRNQDDETHVKTRAEGVDGGERGRTENN